MSVQPVPVERLPATCPSYLCFTLDTEEDLAQRVFLSRFGHLPEDMFFCNNLLWLGPIEEEDNNDG
jgi:hypothetical protein